MADDAVLVRSADGIAVVTLNRPDNRNSMTAELLDGFAAALAHARADAGVRCLVITGRGSCFSAGADFKAELQRGGSQLAHERSFAMYEPFLGVLDVDVPVIAACNGHTVGGGLGLALLCDIRIGCRASKYGANFARLGLHPGLAISYLLPRLVGASRAAELLFTGRLVLGDEAERIGLLGEAVDADQVLPRALEIAGAIAAAAPIAVRLTKRSLYRGLGWQVRDAAAQEAFAQAATLATEDVREGIQALLEKRDPRFQGR
jgi:enoyl-CoA hydratase